MDIRLIIAKYDFLHLRIVYHDGFLLYVYHTGTSVFVRQRLRRNRKMVNAMHNLNPMEREFLRQNHK